MQGRKRDADVGNGLVDAVGEDRVGQIESVRPTYIHCRCTMESCWEAAVWHRELSLVPCDDLEGWGRLKREEMQACLWSIPPEWHSDKEFACRCRSCGFDSWGGKIP